jgi:flagella basal body P-ring formation protein FlgA
MAKKDNESKTSVRVGISESAQELHFETHLEATKVVQLANEAISAGKTFEVTDIKERVILVPAGKISYIEIGDATDQKVGFTSL